MVSSVLELPGEKAQEDLAGDSGQHVSPSELLENEKATTVEPFGKARAILISTMIVLTQLVQVCIPFTI